MQLNVPALKTPEWVKVVLIRLALTQHFLCNGVVHVTSFPEESVVSQTSLFSRLHFFGFNANVFDAI